ncbi:hypothetical protein FOMPIDRAFT_131365 [Fomitopsis schrenkii]|uniref:Uncharacterized protein n=1 Tax=Fomitopsis schrenkii TaxID=2126942 RepID=S8F0W7_FOMSC|nr:hypothetical protein FOMPIDRAFT_131365 [Fomitopsis schrenkii]
MGTFGTSLPDACSAPPVATPQSLICSDNPPSALRTRRLSALVREDTKTAAD